MKAIHYYGSEVRGRTATSDPARGSFLPKQARQKPGSFRRGKTKREHGR